MYTSDIDRRNGGHGFRREAGRNCKAAFTAVYRYLLAALFCGLFSFVYERFSHGVYSNYMVYLFLFPLAGGMLPYGALWLTGGRYYPGSLATGLYNCGIATLTVGSCMQGVLEIYGTTSIYMPVYWITGCALTFGGLLAFLIFLISRKSAYGNR